MKFIIVFALAFATVSAKDLYFHSIEVSVLEKEGRITNGKNAAPGQIYYQVGLSLRKGLNRLWCGGSLIGNNWILTAAHCTDGVSLATVYLGATQRLTAEKTHNASKSDMISHPDWNPHTVKNDICLIRIPTTFESGRIGIIRIPSNNDLKYLGYIVVVSGWGYTNDENHALSNDLKYGILKVSPESDCSAIYKSYFSYDTNICVDTPDKVSTCQGDSGGPLVLEDQKLQIGLDSFGSRKGCAIRRPLVFTRISAYLSWIKLHTGIDYNMSQDFVP